MAASVQAKLEKPHDPRLYSPNRDVAHNFDWVMLEVARRCEVGMWPEMRAYAKEHGVTDEDLGRVCQALCLFVMRNQPGVRQTMAESLATSGYFDPPPAARTIVMAYLGTVMLGMQWAGVREATLGSPSPLLSYQNLVWHGRRCALLMKMPRWKRALHKVRARFKRAWRMFRKDY